MMVNSVSRLEEEHQDAVVAALAVQCTLGRLIGCHADSRRPLECPAVSVLGAVGSLLPHL